MFIKLSDEVVFNMSMIDYFYLASAQDFGDDDKRISINTNYQGETKEICSKYCGTSAGTKKIVNKFLEIVKAIEDTFPVTILINENECKEEQDYDFIYHTLSKKDISADTLAVDDVISCIPIVSENIVSITKNKGKLVMSYNIETSAESKRPVNIALSEQVFRSIYDNLLVYCIPAKSPSIEPPKTEETENKELNVI